MQRRAAALYIAFFLLVGAVAFSLIATASEPQLVFQDPDHELSEGGSFTVGDREYVVTAIEADESDEEGTESFSATLEYTNDSARFTETWDNGSTVTFDGTEWTVNVTPGENVSRFELVETINRTAILRNDSRVENETVLVEGTEYVVRQDDGNRTLIPAERYFPDPETREFREGETVQYLGNETTISAVENDGVTLTWTGPRAQSVDVINEANLTLNGRTYFAYLPNEETLVLTTEFDTYQRHQAEASAFQRHKNGLWGVTIVSGIASVLLVGLAYLPSRY